MSVEALIGVSGISKRFGVHRAVTDVDLTVERGELVALLGPSGSGKTTLLRLMAGFEVPDAGSVTLAGREVAGPGVWVEPEKRRVGVVFQDGALFPHLSVEANVRFGEPEQARAEECLDLVGLLHRAKAFPHELSGGERQRVALARALAPRPEVVLMDEPFAALDAGLRASLREDVAEILRAAATTVVLVTHDQDEALSMADQVVVMNAGRIVQSGPPQEIYLNPSSAWIAEFLGAAEVLPALKQDGDVACELGRFPFDGVGDGPFEVIIRPELIELSDGFGPDWTPATVVANSFFGHDQIVRLELASGRQIRSRTTGAVRWRDGDRVGVKVTGPIVVLPTI